MHDKHCGNYAATTIVVEIMQQAYVSCFYCHWLGEFYSPVLFYIDYVHVLFWQKLCICLNTKVDSLVVVNLSLLWHKYTACLFFKFSSIQCESNSLLR